MKYFEVITASKTWTCPKSGIYKIIAVGGGSSHAVRCDFGTTASSVSETLYTAGGVTSFGNILTAKGGVPSKLSECKSSTTKGVIPIKGGAGGYTLQNYGGEGGMSFDDGAVLLPPTINGGCPGYRGLGYGAGGAVSSYVNTHQWTQSVSGSNRTIYIVGIGSAAGELSEIITDIQSGTQYSCTIGSGGAVNNDMFKAMCSRLGIELDENRREHSTAMNVFGSLSLPGRNGCIVIEYLGESL
jgi:hypothetical protein